MSTPHNAAEKGQIAETVLMPGDPLRAKFIAETFLSEVQCYNTVRNMLGFTGLYKGKRLSVQGSGMGMPSIGIYSYELYHFYGAEQIIRIGSAGGIADDVQLMDIIAAVGATTNSNYMAQYQLPGTFAPICSYPLLSGLMETAKRLVIPVKAGNVLSSDTFYDDSDSLAVWQKMGVLAVEMEAAALYANAARAGKQALAIFTVSDCPLRGEGLSAKEREQGFLKMMELTLETVGVSPLPLSAAAGNFVR